jgi:hypothetical protein
MNFLQKQILMISIIYYTEQIIKGQLMQNQLYKQYQTENSISFL